MWFDALGTPVPPADPAARIVSLVPSLTELLFALGLDKQVVGRTRFCVHPEDRVTRVPVVGGTKDVDLERVRALSATHALVNVDENLATTAEALRAYVPSVIVTHPNTPEDNLDLYRLVGGVFGRADAANALAAALDRELAACQRERWPRERVLYLIWRKPWMSVASDTYIAATLATVGWDVVHGPGGAHGAARYPVVDDLDAVAADVDRILLPSEPFPFAEKHASELRARYPDTPIDLIDGEMTSWYGPRAIDGLAYLRRFREARLRRG